MKEVWTDMLDAHVYERLCNCCSRRSDILPLAQAKYTFEKFRNEEYEKEQALAEILDHLNCNSQFFDLTREEYDDILFSIM